VRIRLLIFVGLSVFLSVLEHRQVKRNYLVEVGRVCLINYGADAGKLCVILDVVDQSRALVDGPVTGVARQTIPFTRLSLTPIKMNIQRGLGVSGLTKAFTAQKVQEAFNQTTWAKKLARQQVRKSLNDFDRFKVMVLRKKRSALVSREFAKLRAASAKKAVKA